MTSWLPAGPITPTMLEFDANDCATVEAIAGFSCVSPWTMLSFTEWLLFHWVAKNSAQCSWSSPIDAAGPVNGPSMPIWIGFEHETEGAAACAVFTAGLAVAAKASASDRARRSHRQSVVPLLTIKPPVEVGLMNRWKFSAGPTNSMRELSVCTKCRTR